MFCYSGEPSLRPWSLAPETCRKFPLFVNLFEDQVGQAKAERTLVLRARVTAWQAITGMVARTVDPMAL